MPRDEFDMRLRKILMDLADDGNTGMARQKAGGLKFLIDFNNPNEVFRFKKMIRNITARRLRKKGTSVLRW